MDWRHRGACREEDPELFFSLSDEPKLYAPAEQVRVAAAKAVCVRCPVQNECLTHALEEPELYGIWGGTGEEERRSLRRRTLIRRAV